MNVEWNEWAGADDGDIICPLSMPVINSLDLASSGVEENVDATTERVVDQIMEEFATLLQWFHDHYNNKDNNIEESTEEQNYSVKNSNSMDTLTKPSRHF